MVAREIPYVHNVGRDSPSYRARLDAAAGGMESGRRHIASSASLRSHCVDLGRHTWACRLSLPLAGSPDEAAAEQIEARAAKHLAFQHLETVDVSSTGLVLQGKVTPALTAS